ncbi:ABC transporter substrate-binding protein [Micromonospora tulbaghiae]|uniref:Iron complex transport system substrate-binding protein n=1 Tax=Micromonospora tulbaghiae TaxID=479978 RepID=A0ABY0KVB0_9ACTN|nr:ABC transporter substrate-binding protein [Micromonospora tulbaghiae]MDX5459578.1 ABC transporter substrate-binding protein [Micromonospora tulbaghiae]SCF15852.1 iron complex transport system substrate-binding protein [Micromonospora tulbaghiae]
MSVRQHWRVIAAAAVTLAVVTGCGSDGGDSAAESGDAATRVFAADNGEITIPADPKRVVATGYAVPVLIEADAALVGISSWKRGLALMTEEDRATYERLPKVAGEAAAETNYEAVAAAKPDLIVIGVPKPALGSLDMKRLESIAPVVAIGPTTPAAWRELSRRQSDAAGRGANFEAAKQAYDKKAAELKDKYGTALAGLRFGHVGSYGEIAKGTFHREFAGSWGTNIAQDAGVTYYGEVKEKGGGGLDVTEYPAIEELPKSLGEADAITYTLQPDGTPAEAVQQVLDSALWKNLPAVQAGRVFGLQYTEAATYESALRTLDSIDKAFAPLLNR